jgi:hypothetical protein
MIMRKNLHDRFIEFCRRYPGAEDIDELKKLLIVPPGMKIADYLFQARTIICEVKTLEQETQVKLEKYMRGNGIEPSNLLDGQPIIEELFLRLDDGKRNLQKAMSLISTPITKGLDDAERQIRDTKKLFNIQNSDGLLVILNDLVTMASPPLVQERLAQRLRKVRVDGSPYHKNINYIVFICEKYITYDDLYQHLLLSFQPESNGVAAFVKDFMEKWAAFNGQTSAQAGPEHEKLLKESKLFIKVK